MTDLEWLLDCWLQTRFLGRSCQAIPSCYNLETPGVDITNVWVNTNSLTSIVFTFSRLPLAWLLLCECSTTSKELLENSKDSLFFPLEAVTKVRIGWAEASNLYTWSFFLYSSSQNEGSKKLPGAWNRTLLIFQLSGVCRWKDAVNPCDSNLGSTLWAAWTLNSQTWLTLPLHYYGLSLQDSRIITSIK